MRYVVKTKLHPTMKRNYLLLLFILACIFLSIVGCNDDGYSPDQEDPQQEIDPYDEGIVSFFESMQEYEAVPSEYNIGSQVTSDSTCIGEYTDTDGTLMKNAAKVVKTKSYSIVENAHEYVTLNPWSALFPGALVAGNQLSNGTVPTLIPIYSKRKPNSIYLAMVAGAEVALPNSAGNAPV